MYAALIFCNVLVINTLWVKNLRTSVPYLFAVSLVVSVGMWLERYVIIVTSLHRDFLPSSWGMYQGTPYDWAAFVGTLGLFLTLMFLFVRFLPAISIFEMRTILPGADVGDADVAAETPATGPAPPAGAPRGAAS
jgi:molybdopterin-containing oxidoreductase family membrane subunit